MIYLIYSKVGEYMKDYEMYDNDIKIVVETMGGVNPAFDFVSKK